MTAKLIASFSLLLALSCHSEPSYREKLLHNSAFTGQLCSEAPPHELMLRIKSHPSQELHINFSEAAIDCFHEAYATRLAAFTNEKFPDFKVVRQSIQDTFGDLHRALTAACDSSGRHTWERLPGKVEWIIYAGYQSNFEASSTDFSNDHIQQAVRIFSEACHAPADRQAAVASHVASALKHLQFADELLNPTAKRYFRAQLMGMIGEFYGAK